MKIRNKNNIYLIGFMGSGKSTVGPLLAKKMDGAFLDTDAWIVSECGKSITKIFAEDGEAFFRGKEQEVIRLVSQLENLVVSVGGGAVMNSQNWLMLNKTGVIVYLQCDSESIYNRIKNDESRPLLNQSEDKKAEIQNLLKKRTPVYKKADIIVDVSQLPPDQIAEEIVNKIRNCV